jgi:hypothetical protein
MRQSSIFGNVGNKWKLHLRKNKGYVRKMLFYISASKIPKATRKRNEPGDIFW